MDDVMCPICKKTNKFLFFHDGTRIIITCSTPGCAYTRKTNIMKNDIIKNVFTFMESF